MALLIDVKVLYNTHMSDVPTPAGKLCIAAVSAVVLIVACAHSSDSSSTRPCFAQEQRCSTGCAPLDGCCTAVACTSPPDLCHLRKGAECKARVCIYPILDCPGQACMDGKCVKPPIQLTMTASSSEYLFGRNIFLNNSVHFHANICNISDSDVTVSAYDEGTIGIRELKLDGRVVLPNISTVEFDEDPKTVQAGHLKSLKRGECIEFGVRRVDTINVTTSLYTAFTYVPKPGSYHLQFYYQYSGPDMRPNKVFHGIVTSNPLQFRVVPPH